MTGNVGPGDDPTIPKLMDFLKIAFRHRHVDDVQEILIKREEKLKIEIQQLKEENNAIEADNEKLKRLTSTAEAETALWKTKYKDLELRLKKGALILGLEPLVVNNIEPGSRANNTVPDNGNIEAGLKTNDTVLESSNIEADLMTNDNVAENGSIKAGSKETDTVPESGNYNGTVLNQTNVSNCNNAVPKADFDSSQAGSKGNEHHVIIQISDKSAQTSRSKRVTKESGSVTLKRRQEPEAQKYCRDDNPQPSKRVCLQEQVTVERNMTELLVPDVKDNDADIKERGVTNKGNEDPPLCVMTRVASISVDEGDKGDTVKLKRKRKMSKMTKVVKDVKRSPNPSKKSSDKAELPRIKVSSSPWELAELVMASNPNQPNPSKTSSDKAELPRIKVRSSPWELAEIAMASNPNQPNPSKKSSDKAELPRITVRSSPWERAVIAMASNPNQPNPNKKSMLWASWPVKE